MARNKLADAAVSRHREIIEFVQAGNSQRAAAAKFSVTPALVSYVLKKNGMVTSQVSSHERREAIANFVKNGGSRNDAAQTFKVTLSTVYQACLENGVRTGNRKTGGYSVLKILASLINTPDTLDEIAVKHGVTKQYVGQIASEARDNGIKLHPDRREYNKNSS